GAQRGPDGAAPPDLSGRAERARPLSLPAPAALREPVCGRLHRATLAARDRRARPGRDLALRSLHLGEVSPRRPDGRPRHRPLPGRPHLGQRVEARRRGGDRLAALQGAAGHAQHRDSRSGPPPDARPADRLRHRATRAAGGLAGRAGNGLGCVRAAIPSSGASQRAAANPTIPQLRRLGLAAIDRLAPDRARATCIEDLRIMARRRVPRMFYDYADTGSWTESTYRANEADFAKILFRQRVAVDLSDRSTRSTMVGEEVAMPVALAPTGLTGMQHADGEILAARAAEAFGVPFTLSTMSICSIEDIAEHTTRPFWFQLYVMRDRDFAGRLIDRAKAAGCSALVLTLDLQILGQRHKDIKNGLAAPPNPTLANLIDIAFRPRWALAMLGTRRRQFGNIVGHVTGVHDMASL